MISTGEKIGRYKIRSAIGKGGMGEVFLAEDSELERLVALKVLPADVANDTERLRRFVQEAKAASALNHPNIITIHEISKTDNLHFIATEHIEGETLPSCVFAFFRLALCGAISSMPSFFNCSSNGSES